MNQILFAEEDNSRNSRTTTQLDIHKVIKFLCIFMIIFGVSIASMGSYKLAQIAEKEKPKEEVFPEFDLKKVDNVIYLSVSHAQGIQKLSFKWNQDGVEHVRDGNGRTQISEQIQMPSGTNTLIIKVIDINGIERTDRREFSVEQETGVDIERPVISFIPNAEGTVTIIAIDEAEIDYITYKWNEEPETKVTERDETKKKIQITIPIIKEENILTIIAYDKAGNPKQEKQPFIGKFKPKISVVADGNAFVIKASDDLGLKGVIFDFNGKKYSLPINPEDMQKEVEYRQELKQGLNKITVYVLNVQEVIETYNGQYNYEP